MIDRFLGDAFGVCPARFGLLFCSVVLCRRYTPKLLDRIVSDARFLNGDPFECDIAHCRSVAVLYMLYKIRCNPMQPHYGALPVSCGPGRFTRGALVAHRYTYEPSRCRTSQYRLTSPL